MKPARNPESTWFGAQSVSPEQKTRRVLGVFSSVAASYDRMNDLMSFGAHRLWKDRLVRLVRPMPGQQIIDVAGGTGDIAFRMHKATKGRAAVTVADINPDMLVVGQDRAVDHGILSGLNWVVANAEKLPFQDKTFDAYTIAFGLRNVTHIDVALHDAYRILKPGGRFFCLEFSQVQDQVLDTAYQLWSRYAIPQIGEWVAHDRASYQYLIESIRAFPTQAQLTRRLKDAGFDSVRHVNIAGGIAAIHIADKY